ncbi:MAG TPA: TIGR03118 family protein [Acetobacteraceae bacterium]|nr:TIGR03118 family protein [Acetobacteraceae bacterium]
MQDETTAAIGAGMLYSGGGNDDGRLAFLSPRNASYRQTVLHRHQHSQLFSQDNLVSDDQPGHLNAQLQDADLINPWGVAFSPTGDFWVNNNATGTATLYHVDLTTNTTTRSTLVVTIAPPAGGTGPAAPTGMVFNTDSSGFMVNGKPADFIMDTEDGTISAWNGGTETTLEVDNSNNAAAGDNTVNPAEGIGAVYKGLAIGTETNGTTLLYAANFRHGTVDVFNDQFQQIQSLTDGSLPPGYAPFNVQVLNGDLFVTYAKQDQFKHDDVAGAGNGFVDEYTLNGQLIARVASNGPLNSPWGLTIAPSDFGQYAGDLLVGNFGDGTISAFDLQDHDKYMGKLLGIDGKPITIGDLWALTPGNGGSAGSTGQVYFTSGVQNESFGLFGAIAPVPGSNEFMVSGTGSHSMG